MQIVPQYQLLVCAYGPLQAAAVYFVGRKCWHVQNLQGVVLKPILPSVHENDALYLKASA